MSTLKPFQIEDLARAALRDGAILSWEQGLGKSLAAIAWPVVKGARRTLIIAPENLHLQLITSAAKFFQQSVRPLRSIKEYHDLHLDSPPPKDGPPRFYITSFHAAGLNGADEYHPSFGHKGEYKPNRSLAALRRSWCNTHRVKPDPFLADSIGTTRKGITCIWKPSMARLAAAHGSFDCVVIDEGTRLQASESRMAASIRLLNPSYRLLLTGTPIKNRLESIFWLAAWAAGGRWPYRPTNEARENFANSFLQLERFLSREEIKRSTGEPAHNTTRRSNHICQIHRLWKSLAPVIIRRRKTDCGEEIASKIMNPIIVAPGRSQLAVYQYHLNNPPLRSKAHRKLHRRIQIAQQLTHLRMAALCPTAKSLADSPTGVNGPKRSWTEFTPKFQACLNIIAEIVSSGKQIIIGSPFREFSERIHARLHEGGLSSILLDGTVSPKERGELAADFHAGRYPVLVAGLKSMSEGYSFENCSHLILPGYSYAYDENEQFIHRVWRLNSPGPVTIYPILTEGTIDARLHEIFGERADAASLALDGRLFSDPGSDIDLEHLLTTTIQTFRASTPTIDEQTIVDAWDARTQRILVSAQSSYHRARAFPTGPNKKDQENAIKAIMLPSPTQATVNILRKHYAKGTYRPADQNTITSATKKLRNLRSNKK